MSREIEIEPASLAQVTRTQQGRLVAMDDDVQGVARRLREIDAGLRVHYDPDEAYFVVRHEQRLEDGSMQEQLVLTALELDHRIVHRIEQIAASDYDFGAELDRLEDRRVRDKDHAFSERTGPLREQLDHALQRDLGIADGRAFIGGR